MIPCVGARAAAAVLAAVFGSFAFASGAVAASKPGKHAERPWGAVAYSTKTGVYGYSVDHSTRRAAESEAHRLCGPDCEFIRSFRDTCGAVAAGGRKAIWETGASREIAEMRALRACGKGGGAGNQCKVAVWACTRINEPKKK